jgi:SAM-dependent methyltransferase
MHRVCFQESNKIVSVILVTAERLGPLVESDRLFRIHATNYHNSDRSAEKRGPEWLGGWPHFGCFRLQRRRMKPQVRQRPLSDLYDGKQRYEESFHEYFDAKYTVDLIRAVWKKKPPFRLLDVGSASGLTLQEFEELSVEAWGVENNPYIHRRTPALLRRNLRGDVRSLPFQSSFFDFAYDTCLCYLPPRDVPRAIRELHRTVKIGIHFGGITTDMTREVIEEHDLLRGVQIYILPQKISTGQQAPDARIQI